MFSCLAGCWAHDHIVCIRPNFVLLFSNLADAFIKLIWQNQKVDGELPLVRDESRSVKRKQPLSKAFFKRLGSQIKQ